MRYAIVANPSSGRIPPEKKRLLLREPAAILDAKVYGLDARTPEEFIGLTARTARECDVLVGAGGDGTMSMIVHAIERNLTPVAFLPFGTGNALRHALQLGESLARIAHQIRDAPIRRVDLIDCGGRLAFSASLGIEAAVVRLRKRYAGATGYMLAALIAYFHTYRRISGILEIDGAESRLDGLLTLLVVKHPFHGYRMKVVPEAKLDDGKIHVLAVSSGFWRSIFWAIAALVFSNRSGHYYSGKSVKVVLDRPHTLQADGEELWEARAFCFKIMERALMIKA